MSKKTEIRIIFFCAVFVLLVALAPFIYGHISSSGEKKYVELVNSIPFRDVNSYFAWIKQASDGSVLFEDKYIIEPHNKWIFHPVFLLMGGVVRFTHVDVAYVWYAVILLADALLLFSLYRFISYFLPDPEPGDVLSKKGTVFGGGGARVVAFLLAISSAGFSWLAGFYSADSFMAEMSLFQSMRWPFIFALAIALMLEIFLALFKFIASRKLKYAAYAGLMALALAFIHPYDVVIVVIAGLGWVVFKMRKEHLKGAVAGCAVFAAILLPGVLYNFLVLFFDPVFRTHSMVEMLSPGIVSYILGWGAVLWLAGAGVYMVVRKKNERYYFLLVWLLAAAALLYAPISFQRRFAMGLIIPLSILAALAVGRISEKARTIKPVFVILPIIIFSFFGALNFSAGDIMEIKRGEFPNYVEKDFFLAMEWFGDNAPENAVVMTSEINGSFIPRYSRAKTFIGHWAQVLDLDKKLEQSNIFYSDGVSEEFFSKFIDDNNISYILCTAREKDCKGDNWRSRVKSLGWQTVFLNGTVEIYGRKK
jgi:hypothetical protein